MTGVTAPDGMYPLQRCCAQHNDWTTLAEHLLVDFPTLAPGDVLRELSRAKSAVKSFGLDDAEQLGVAELMARHQLLLTTGEVPDIARLDPERHVRSGLST